MVNEPIHMWIKPLNLSPFHYENNKDSKIKCIELHEVKQLIRKHHRGDAPVAITVNKCQWIKNDGNVCCAKLKHGNKFCLRHMKMVK